MADYQKLYTLLFNAMTDAICQIEQQNFGTAMELLSLSLLREALAFPRQCSFGTVS